MKILILSVLLFLVQPTWARSSACSRSDLKRKNCLIKALGYELSFLDEKVSINNGVWRKVEKLPLVGPKTEWESLRIRNIANTKLLEMLVWSEPVGEAKVQSLHWMVLRLEGVGYKKALDRVVRKRTKSSTKEGKYIYDKKVSYQLMAHKKKVYWKHGKEKQRLKQDGL